MKTITLFTDGGCRGNPGIGAWAFYCPELDIRSYGFNEDTTNNKMELTAILEGLKWVMSLDSKDYDTIEIWTDSNYAVDIFNKYIWNWLKTGALQSKKNSDIIGDIMLLRKLLTTDEWKIRFHHLRGHCTHPQFIASDPQWVNDVEGSKLYWEGNREVDGLVNLSMDLRDSIKQDRLEYKKLEWWVSCLDDIITSIREWKTCPRGPCVIVEAPAWRSIPSGITLAFNLERLCKLFGWECEFGSLVNLDKL